MEASAVVRLFSSLFSALRPSITDSAVLKFERGDEVGPIVPVSRDPSGVSGPGALGPRVADSEFTSHISRSGERLLTGEVVLLVRSLERSGSEGIGKLASQPRYPFIR